MHIWINRSSQQFWETVCLNNYPEVTWFERTFYFSCFLQAEFGDIYLFNQVTANRHESFQYICGTFPSDHTGKQSCPRVT